MPYRTKITKTYSTQTKKDKIKNWIEHNILRVHTWEDSLNNPYCVYCGLDINFAEDRVFEYFLNFKQIPPRYVLKGRSLGFRIFGKVLKRENYG